MPRIVAIIATKNRPELLKNALASVLRQTRKPDLFIVTSDSTPDNFKAEQALVGDSATLIQDQYAHNYAGNLNTAIDFLLRQEIHKVPFDIDDIFCAFLDDDDVWHDDYLEKCVGLVGPKIDLVVPLIHYLAEGKDFILDLPPENLNEKSFLAFNPHIQGSNTFIRLKTLLMAGTFDENMDSTTDRDFFTRVLLLHPEIAYYPHPLVDVDAFDSRPRLTNDAAGKARSLSLFYSKYSGLMDSETKSGFFKRALRYTDLTLKTVPDHLSSSRSEPYEPPAVPTDFNRRIVIGFIASDLGSSLRLLQDIRAQKLANYEVVIFANGPFGRNYFTSDCPSSHLKVILLSDVKKHLAQIPFADYIRPSTLRGDKITDIAVARMILHYYLKAETKEGDVIWVLDDDMRLETVVREGSNFKRIPLSLVALSKQYLNKADVVIGSYTGDAPLPVLSTLRTSLLDYAYRWKLQKRDNYETVLYDQRDYYYDLADSHLSLETPLPLDPSASLNAIFSGQATSRFLHATSQADFEPYSRGGNTIIYNRAVLDTPNISPVFGPLIARRSDYFWVEELREQGFKVVGASYGTRHARMPHEHFDFSGEQEKFIKDLLGSSFTKAVGEVTVKDRDTFYASFTRFLESRLVRSLDSGYRVLGLLQIIDDKEYRNAISEDQIKDTLRKCRPYFDKSLAESAYDYMMSLKNHYYVSKRIPKFTALISDYLGQAPKLLGFGNEGAVYALGHQIYKIFYQEEPLPLLERYATEFSKCPELFPIQLFRIGNHPVLTYDNGGTAHPYEGGYAQSFAELIRFLRKRGLVLNNVKRENFMLINKQLKFIDYGNNLVPLTPELYEMEVRRVYEMLCYPRLSIPEYKQVIALSHLGQDETLCQGISNFKKLIELRSKEAIHDPLVLQLANSYHPSSVLDYGAGKCKIINALSASKKAAFDIDQAI
jgi:glycosyltransferase involved in cell wall biosynthesis